MKTKKSPVMAGNTIDGANVKETHLFEDYNEVAAEQQRETFLKHLEEFGSISTIEARELGILSPNSVVHRLRKGGYRIKTDKVVEDGHRVARYRFMTAEEIKEEEAKQIFAFLNRLARQRGGTYGTAK